MNVWHVVGALLVVIGVAEWFFFNRLAKTRANIARQRGFLTANALFNILVGLALIIVL